jgi:hypothetical protein
MKPNTFKWVMVVALAVLSASLLIAIGVRAHRDKVVRSDVAQSRARIIGIRAA